MGGFCSRANEGSWSEVLSPMTPIVLDSTVESPMPQSMSPISKEVDISEPTTEASQASTEASLPTEASQPKLTPALPAAQPDTTPLSTTTSILEALKLSNEMKEEEPHDANGSSLPRIAVVMLTTPDRKAFPH